MHIAAGYPLRWMILIRSMIFNLMDDFQSHCTESGARLFHNNLFFTTFRLLQVLTPQQRAEVCVAYFDERTVLLHSVKALLLLLVAQGDFKPLFWQIPNLIILFLGLPY